MERILANLESTPLFVDFILLLTKRTITHKSRKSHGATCGWQILLLIVEAGMPLLQ